MILAQARQCVRDVLMNFLSRNMAQVEVFILQIKGFRNIYHLNARVLDGIQSLYLPGQCDVKVGQVHMVSLQDEVTIIE